MLTKVLSIFVIVTFTFVAVQSTDVMGKEKTDPSPPIWGGALQYSVNVSMLYNKPIMTWNMTYYYNWNVKAEAYIHHAPQADEMCLFANPPFGINSSCIATFATDGWSYIEYPQHNWCCKCEKSFGAVKSNWLQGKGKYEGETTVDGMAVTHWTEQGIYLNHYYSTVDKQLPVKFAEKKNGIPKEWTFDLKSYNAGSFDPQILKPKCGNLCHGKCVYFRGLQQEKERQSWKSQ